jgi:hypothetical protein
LSRPCKLIDRRGAQVDRAKWSSALQSKPCNEGVNVSSTKSFVALRITYATFIERTRDSANTLHKPIYAHRRSRAPPRLRFLPPLLVPFGLWSMVGFQRRERESRQHPTSDAARCSDGSYCSPGRWAPSHCKKLKSTEE